MSLECQLGGQGVALQNGTCGAGAEYCGTLLPKEGTKEGQKFYSCYKKSSLTAFGYSKTPADTLTCQSITVKSVDAELCACTKDYCNYGSVLKVSKQNLFLIGFMNIRSKINKNYLKMQLDI